jgi:hypothetical protein
VPRHQTGVETLAAFTFRGIVIARSVRHRVVLQKYETLQIRFTRAQVLARGVRDAIRTHRAIALSDDEDEPVRACDGVKARLQRRLFAREEMLHPFEMLTEHDDDLLDRLPFGDEIAVG